MLRVPVDLSTKIGKIELPNPVVAASGSYGHSDELFDVVDINEIGAITLKSLAPFESLGNEAPRVAPLPTGMMNSVGLPGPPIADWAKTEIDKLQKSDARFIGAFWGHSIEHYVEAAKVLAEHSDAFIAIEANLSCPNTDKGGELFAQNPDDVYEIVSKIREAIGEEIFLTTKLTSAVTKIVPIAEKAIEAGTDALTLFNTSLGLNIDPYTRKATLGKGGGGYSGAGVFPIVQRGVFEVHKAFPETPIVGVGGVMNGENAASLMMCGASAVGVATAVFADPNAPIRIAKELEDFCEKTGVKSVSELIGAVHTSS